MVKRANPARLAGRRRGHPTIAHQIRLGKFAR
jgi:hypothetical protein